MRTADCLTCEGTDSCCECEGSGRCHATRNTTRSGATVAAAASASVPPVTGRGHARSARDSMRRRP